VRPWVDCCLYWHQSRGPLKLARGFFYFKGKYSGYVCSI
jgi:hypothetical protein